MKKFALLICLCLFVMTMTGCTQRSTPKENEFLERVCVDISTDGDGFYTTFADVTIVYYDDEVSYIAIDNPTLLAFNVSDKYDGGVCLINGSDIEQLIQQLEYTQSLLDNADTETALEYVGSILKFLRMQDIYDYCPT